MAASRVSTNSEGFTVNVTKTKPGDFVWYELLTTDPKAAIPFYEYVIGWSSKPMDDAGGYTLFTNAADPVGGTTGLPEAAKQIGAPPHWLANVLVSDVDATVTRVSQLGGRVIAPPAEYAGVGRFAVVADPFGAMLSVFAPSTPMKARNPEVPGEICWHELLSENHEAAFEFYAKLFGWKKRSDFDMGAMGKYLLYGDAERDKGGMFTKPKDMPVSAWLYYIEVSNLDAAVSRGQERGGKLCNGPMQVPGGARIAQLSDPQGAMFALHERQVGKPS